MTRPRSRSFRDVIGPTPHSRSTGKGWRKACSSPGGTTSSPSGFATPLATFARNFVHATPTVSGSPTRVVHLVPEPCCDLGGAAGDPLEAAHVEERLVDGEPLDNRRRIFEEA